MSYKFVGPVGKQFRGDEQRAMTLMGSARLLAQQALDRIEAMGGRGVQVSRHTLGDGSTVEAWVNKQAGQPPLVRVRIWCPEGEQKGLIIAIPFEVFDGAATHAFVAEFCDDGTFYRLVPLGYIGTSLPTYEEDYPVCGPYYVVGSSPKDPMTMGTFSIGGVFTGEGGFRNRYDPTIEGSIYQSGKRIGTLPAVVHGAVIAGGLILIGDYHAGELTWYKKVEGEWEPQVVELVVATDTSNNMVWSQAIQFYKIPDGLTYGVGYIGYNAVNLAAAAEVVLSIDEEGALAIVSVTLTAANEAEVISTTVETIDNDPEGTDTSTGNYALITTYDLTSTYFDTVFNATQKTEEYLFMGAGSGELSDYEVQSSVLNPAGYSGIVTGGPSGVWTLNCSFALAGGTPAVTGTITRELESGSESWDITDTTSGWYFGFQLLYKGIASTDFQRDRSAHSIWSNGSRNTYAANKQSPYRGTWQLFEDTLQTVTAKTQSVLNVSGFVRDFQFHTECHATGQGGQERHLNEDGSEWFSPVLYEDTDVSFGSAEYSLVTNPAAPEGTISVSYTLLDDTRTHYIDEQKINYGQVGEAIFDTIAYKLDSTREGVHTIQGESSERRGPPTSLVAEITDSNHTKVSYIFDSDPEYSLSTFFELDGNTLVGKCKLLATTEEIILRTKSYVELPTNLGYFDHSTWKTGTSSVTRCYTRDSSEGRLYSLAKTLLDLALISGGWWRSTDGYGLTVFSETKADVATAIQTWFTTKYPDQDVRFLGLSIYKLST